MKHLYWQDTIRYTRPDNHPDVQVWQRIIDNQKRIFGRSSYTIRSNKNDKDI